MKDNQSSPLPKNGKRSTQKVWIKLADNPEDSSDYSARITFSPAIEGREVSEDSPSLNAAARLWMILQERKAWLGEKLPEDKVIVPDRFTS